MSLIDVLKQDYRLVELIRPEDYTGSYCFVLSKKYPFPLQYIYNSKDKEEFIFPHRDGTYNLTMESLVSEGSIIGHDRKANNAWTMAQLVVLETLDIPTEDIKYFLSRYSSSNELKVMIEKWSPWYFIEAYDDLDSEDIIFEILPLHLDALGLKGFTSTKVSEVFQKLKTTSITTWRFEIPQEAILIYQ